LGANAKFNNGNFTALRTLYTLGIQSMAKLEHSLGPKEAEMLSNMHSNVHSNRAFPFFGANNFNLCRQGCEVAIPYNPYYEKSWIRKWRALMALGSAAATQAQAAAAAQYPTTTTTTKNETKPTTTTSTDDNRDPNIPPSVLKRAKQQAAATSSVQRNTQKPVPEDKRLRKGGRRKNAAHAIMRGETDNKSENDSFSSVGDLNGKLSENEWGGYADWNVLCSMFFKHVRYIL
jgi:hypothetical protein